MSSFARLRYEIRLLGVANLALIPSVIVVFLGVIVLATWDSLHNGLPAPIVHADNARILLLLLEMGLPPVAGFAAATIASQDPAKELHLACVSPYPATIFRRLALFTAWAVLICVVVVGVIHVTGYWIAPQPSPQDQLVWLAPLLVFSAAGALLALLLRNRTASIAVLGVIWVSEALLRSLFLLEDIWLRPVYLFLTSETLHSGLVPNASYWLQNRLTLIGIAAVCFAITALLLRRNEALLGAES